jgi:hypothetical protein
MSFFTQIFAQPKPPHPLIAPHPRIGQLRLERIMGLIFTVFILIVSIITTFIGSMTLGEVALPWPLLITISLWFCSIGISFVAERRWMRIELLRVAAIQEDQRLLADEQPQPNVDGLQVPVNIAMHISMGTPLILSLALIVLADICFLFVEWLDHQVDALTWLLVLFMTAFIGIIMVFTLTVLWKQRWVVEIRLRGIKSRISSFGMTDNGAPLMFWHEAHLFSCYSRPGFWNKGSVMIYELSSASQVVCWTWVRSKEPLSLRLVPDVSFEEHQIQMREMCELVVAKTGLRLYDLSKMQYDKKDR